MAEKPHAFDFDDRIVFRQSAIRLHAALLGRGYSGIPTPAALYESLCERYEMQDFQLARALTSPTNPPHWHLIRIGSAGEALTDGTDRLTIAPSLARASAGLQVEMDQARVFPHTVVRRDNGFGLYARDGDLIASIESIGVQPADLRKRARVNDLIQGLRIHRDGGHFVKRLSRLPGFHALHNDAQARHEDDPIGAMALATVDNQCVAMRRMLSQLHGIRVAQPDAQALVALTFGAVDWATYSAARDTAPELLMPAAIVHWARHESINKARVTLYRSVAEAIFEFAQFAERASPRLFPVFSGVTRTAYSYAPWLHADIFPPKPDSPPGTRSPHQCSYLALLNYDVQAEIRARMFFADALALTDKVQEFFVTEGSAHDRLRASNRRLGITSSEELFIGEWLFTAGTYDKAAQSRYLTIERFRGDRRVLSDTVTLNESIYVCEIQGRWCVLSECATQPVVVLEGVGETDARRMASQFAIPCKSHKLGGSPEAELPHHER